ncbi:hypothetical protein [Oleiharenicola lentus]|uniref:hypothetical protein n=1 Tax=Oleiharenicola lentus TaxID=2508720 RepID=UPI003F67F0C8
MVSDIGGAARAPKFGLGRLVTTPGALAAVSPPEMARALRRHVSGDWGDVCKEDWKSNDDALSGEGRLFSVYTTASKERFWVITEWDRSLTTVLLPSEY